ncbi:hypothetical protein CHUAL_004115 [Chamberlinius hualienensis]
MDTPAEPYFLSILQHLLCIREEPNARVAYFRLIEECVSQIVLHRSGCDPDFRKNRKIQIDVEPLISQLSEKSREESSGKSSKELNKKLDEAITAKQESEAKIAQLESKLHQYENGQVQTDCVMPTSRMVGAPPPPPPMPGMGGAGPPPPPPMPGMGGPPPPPPMPGMGGPPPPPPMPGMGGPPPPPPMPGKGGPPPPPPPPGFAGPPPPSMPAGPPPLPHGLKPKKKYKLEVPLKKAAWKQVDVRSLSKDAFWVHVNEESLPCEEIFKQLNDKFSTKPAGKTKADGNAVVEKKLGGKKLKELKVLDGKTAQNLAILLGSLKLSSEDMKRGILRLDEQCISIVAVEQLLDLWPPPDVLKQLDGYRDQIKELADSEQFVLSLSTINRLIPRLKSFKFKLRFDEMIQDTKPEIVAATEACDEIRNSKKFAKILEVVLLIGNYMNTGSNNAQAFGFDINFLTKLSGTKAVDNKTTLLHFLTLLVENKFPEAKDFGDELLHCDKAAKVSTEQIQKTVGEMKKSLQQLELDLKNHTTPINDDDKFIEIMSDFAASANKQYELLEGMFKKMENSYKSLSEFYAFDSSKYTLDDFFGDITTFKNSFRVALKDNQTQRETEEKIQKAKEAREKLEKDKQLRQDSKNALINMDADDNQVGVVDSLLEALTSGKAFGVLDQTRKRAPRATGAARQAQLNRSRSRSGLNVSMSPMTLDINTENGTGNGAAVPMEDGPPKPRRVRKGVIDQRGRRTGGFSDGTDDLLERLNAL